MPYPSISDYNNSVVDSDCFADELTNSYHLESVSDNYGSPFRITGGLGAVYKMRDDNTGKVYAMKVFTQEQPLRQDAYKKIYDYLRYEQSSYLAKFEYYPKGIYVDYDGADDDDDYWFPVVLMEWVDGVTLDKYISENIGNQGKMETLIYRLSRMSQWLYAQPFAHGDIKPDNILVRESDESLVLVDYDGMYVPSMAGEKMRETGTADWAHPNRANAPFDSHIDDFSLSVLMLSVRAIMLDPSLLKSGNGKSTDRLVLCNEDYLNVSQSDTLADMQRLFGDECFCRLYSLFLLANARHSLAGVDGSLFSSNLPCVFRMPMINFNNPSSGSVVKKSSILPIAVNGVSFNMVFVEGGTFMMGHLPSDSQACVDESPVHEVELSSYYIGEVQVTQELWEAVMRYNPSFFTSDRQCPVECVLWDDCQEFIKKLNELTGKKFSLPTEAQWEYAAKGGNKTKNSVFAGSESKDDVAWYHGNSGSATHPVKTKRPNELGIYDMSGNVWEWCQDWYGGYADEKQTNPNGPTSGPGRVLRGGSWGDFSQYCRVSSRLNYDPVYSRQLYGLRLTLSL